MPNVGRVNLRNISVDPTEVLPGGVVRITLYLEENADIITPIGDLSTCDADMIIGTGLEVETVISIAGRSDITNIVCIPNTLDGTNVEADIDITAPDVEGQYPVSAYIRSTKKDKRSDDVRTTITVSSGSGAVDRPQEPDGDNSGGGLLVWAAENPGITLGLGVAGYVTLKTATEQATDRIF